MTPPVSSVSATPILCGRLEGVIELGKHDAHGFWWEPNALAENISIAATAGIPLSVQHLQLVRRSMPGAVVEIRQDGARYELTIGVFNTPEGRHVFALAAKNQRLKMPTALSPGYHYRGLRRNEVTVITQAQMYELSIVLAGSMPGACITKAIAHPTVWSDVMPDEFEALAADLLERMRAAAVRHEARRRLFQDAVLRNGAILRPKVTAPL